MKRVMHIISHSHWDREWYMSFEQHRARLVELMDALIDKMERDPRYQYYHLDGQTVVLEDYLELRPEMQDRLDRLIRDGRIQVGPWYVLQDEFLTSGEANVRNLLEGLRYCAEHGYTPVMTGYLPDSFGNISQMPQLLKGFGIDNAVFSRGVSTVFADNKPLPDSGADREWNWYGADGSKVIGIMFTYWYNNANELPVDEEEAKERYAELIRETSEASHTPHLLGMNGCDHQPIQLTLPESLHMARQLFGDQVEIRHSNLKDYLECVRPYADSFREIRGELTDQRTGGMCRLVDTATTHIPLKLSNHKVQNMLQQQSEPISVMAALGNDSYRAHLLRYAWKTLMQNHPHDSICACSCDAVAREMAVRFEKAYQVAEYVRDEAAAYLADRINTSQDAERNIVVFHTSAKHTDGTVSINVHLDEYCAPEDMYITDRSGNVVGSCIRYLGKRFTYTLPKDSFRKVEYPHVYEVRFPVSLSGLGYFVYRLQFGRHPEVSTDLRVFERGAENSYIRFCIQDDGTLCVLDKISGREYTGLHQFEDSGDCGDGYNYKQTADMQSVYSQSMTACVLDEQTDFSVTYHVTAVMEIPAGLSGKNERSQESIHHELHSRITLAAGSRRIDIATTLENKSENHRLRVLFPSNIQAETVMADGQFDVIRRDIVPWEGWENPSYTQRMQAFFGVEDVKGGLLIAGRGLCSYEVLRDGRNTLALDLLRAVGQIGDWGDFPTPAMQVKQAIILHYAIVPYTAKEKALAFDAAYGFVEDHLSAVQTGRHEGALEANKPLLQLEGDLITCTAIKQAENAKGIILRLCNVSEQEQELTIRYSENIFRAATETNLAETENAPVSVKQSRISCTVSPKKIKTYRLV